MGKITIKALDVRDNLPNFDFTEDDKSDPLDTDHFYKYRLKEYEKKRLGKTSLIYDDGNPIGYLTIAMDSFEVISNSRDALHDELRRYPAMLLLQLGIDKNYRRKGSGKKACQIAIGLATELAAKRVGCRYVILQSGTNKVSFFKKSGFLEASATGNQKKWMYTKIT